MFHSDLQKLLFHISQNGRTDLTQPTLHYWPSATEDKRHGWNIWWEMPLDSGPNHILYTSSGSQSYSLQIKCADQPFSRGSCKNCLKSTKSTIFRNYWYSLIICFPLTVAGSRHQNIHVALLFISRRPQSDKNSVQETHIYALIWQWR